MNIIALRGISNTGKTTTIRILHDLFLLNGYQLIWTNFTNPGGDFRSIFSKNNKFIGITSRGDSFDLVFNDLDFLINSNNCTICLCACHTYDRTINNIKHGTNTAIDSFPSFQKQYIDKTIATTPAQELVINQNDAQILFNDIDALV